MTGSLMVSAALPVASRIARAQTYSLKTGPSSGRTQWRKLLPRAPALPAAAPGPLAATPPPRRQASLRIFVVGCGLPCDPPGGGHSLNGGMISRLHRAAIGDGAYALTDSGRAALAAILEDVD